MQIHSCILVLSLGLPCSWHVYSNLQPNLKEVLSPRGDLLRFPWGNCPLIFYSSAQSRGYTSVRCPVCCSSRNRSRNLGQGPEGKQYESLCFPSFTLSGSIGKRTRRKEKFWIVKNGPFGMSTGQWWESAAWFSATISFPLTSSSWKKWLSLATRCLMLKKIAKLCEIILPFIYITSVDFL